MAQCIAKKSILFAQSAKKMHSNVLLGEEKKTEMNNAEKINLLNFMFLSAGGGVKPTSEASAPPSYCKITFEHTFKKKEYFPTKEVENMFMSDYPGGNGPKGPKLPPKFQGKCDFFCFALFCLLRKKSKVSGIPQRQTCPPRGGGRKVVKAQVRNFRLKMTGQKNSKGRFKIWGCGTQGGTWKGGPCQRNHTTSVW